MGESKGHRKFAACWDWSTKHESGAERALRRETCSMAVGRVLELGVGVGANWEYLAEDIDYVGIEPDPFMLERAQARSAASGHERTVQAASAEALPFEDDSFDTVLVTLTLCTIADPARALTEVKRVLKPGGGLVFFEHVRPEGKFGGWFTDRIAPVWGHVAGGCQPNRRTAATLSEAGFGIETMKKQRVNGLPMIAGMARPDSD